MTVTLRDVARACGMDPSTVSRALRRDERVKEATRERIARIAREMGYVPNLNARSLAGARTRTIWYITGRLLDPLQVLAIPEASRYLADSGYELSIILHHGSVDRFTHLLRRLGQGVTDGAIIVPGPVSEGRAELAALQAKHFPLVWFDRYPQELTCPVVTSDNEGAAAALAKQLQEQGAKRFVVLWRRNHNAVEEARFQGVIDFLGAEGIPFVLGDRFTPDFLRPGETLGVIATGQETIQTFLQDALPDGVDLRLGAFDGWRGDPYPARQVTVCRQDLETMARRACDLVLSMIDGTPAEPRLHPIPPHSYETVETRVGR